MIVFSLKNSSQYISRQMPNDTDWLILKRTINGFKGDAAVTWGYITADNAHKVYKEQVKGKNLFEYLLENDCYADANTIASSVPLFTEKNIQTITDRHHHKYTDLIKILSTDKMILLYEEFDKRVNAPNDITTDTNTDMTQTSIADSTKTDFNEVYRSIISTRFEKVMEDDSTDQPIIQLLTEFKFLSHPYLEDFYQFATKLNSNQINNFCSLYKKYQTFIPLIYRVINEYYLEYIKYQVRTIIDLSGNSFIIVSERYEDLRRCLISLPKNYVDYRYQDKNGNNILMYLATIPILTEAIHEEIYQDFIKGEQTMPLNLKNTDGNTLFHIIGEYENEIFLRILIKWFFTTALDNGRVETTKVKISEILSIENNDGNTIFDILLEKKSFTILTHIVEYMPTKHYKRLTSQLIENFDLIDQMPNTAAVQQIYLGSINYYLDNILQMKQDILYDLKSYRETLGKINKLLSKCNSATDFKQSYYLEWLLICIKTTELELFKTIMNKYFYNEQNTKTIKYLNQIIDTEGEPIITSAIKSQNLGFVKNLLNYQIDLGITDRNGKTPLIVALETKNLFLIKVLKEYAVNKKEYQGMTQIMDTFIDLLEKHEVYNSLSVVSTLRKIWTTIEFLFNAALHGLTKTED
jgi:ankyrin repeat protein